MNSRKKAIIRFEKDPDGSLYPIFTVDNKELSRSASQQYLETLKKTNVLTDFLIEQQKSIALPVSKYHEEMKALSNDEIKALPTALSLSYEGTLDDFLADAGEVNDKLICSLQWSLKLGETSANRQSRLSRKLWKKELARHELCVMAQKPLDALNLVFDVCTNVHDYRQKLVEEKQPVDPVHATITVIGKTALQYMEFEALSSGIAALACMAGGVILKIPPPYIEAAAMVIANRLMNTFDQPIDRVNSAIIDISADSINQLLIFRNLTRTIN